MSESENFRKKTADGRPTILIPPSKEGLIPPSRDEKSDKFREECGVFAIWSHPEAAKLAYLGLYALQHRGQESAGITSTDGKKLHSRKGMGHVGEVFTEEVMAALPGHSAIGHTRYSTAGDTNLLNAQPLQVDCVKGQIALAHNGNLVNAASVRRELEARGSIFQTTSDTEVILHLLAQAKGTSLAEAMAETLDRLVGAYTLVLITPQEVIGVRDPRGFRPLSLGRLDGAYVLASETCAFDLINAKYERDIEPGEMVVVNEGGLTSRRIAPPGPHSFCIFEHVYFSRPDSLTFGRQVQTSRESLGVLLAEEHPVEADVVVPVPDSGVAAAAGYSHASGIPIKFALIRNHYVGRTFIEPRQSIRDFGVKLKLNPVRSLLEGRRVILVDDSLVRGTTSRKIVRMVRQAGALEVHLRISCPPTISPCYYGIDTPTKDELIASTQSVEEIRKHCEADSLGYLSMEGMRKAVGDTKGEYCLACYTGNYPIAIHDPELPVLNRR